MRRFSTCMVFWLALAGTASSADERTAREKVLADAELRLRSIYDKREFAPAQFPGKWLPDSSGYWVLEPFKPGAEPLVVKYDAKSGKPPPNVANADGCRRFHKEVTPLPGVAE